MPARGDLGLQPAACPPGNADAAIDAEWRRLVGVAYRIVGRVADAEDAAQEAYLRLERAGDGAVECREAWLTRVCVRICLDRLKSASSRLDRSAGEWLPDLLVTHEADRLEYDETLSLAFVAAMQRLGPSERAVFVLHDLFGDTFDEVGRALDLRPDNCRKIGSRARQRLSRDRRGAVVDPAEVGRLTEAFFDALQGEHAALRRLLADDVTLRACGGNGASVIRSPFVGAERVARFFHRVARAPAWRRLDAHDVWFNGGPGVLLTEGGRVVSAYQLHFEDGRATGILVQRDPAKLPTYASVLPS